MGYLFNSAGMVPSFLAAALILALFGCNDKLNSSAKTPMLIIGIVLSLFYCLAVWLTYRTVREKSSLIPVAKPFRAPEDRSTVTGLPSVRQSLRYCSRYCAFSCGKSR